MATTATTSSAVPTFGVEWEFYACFYQPEPDENVDAILAAYPGTIIVPPDTPHLDAARLYVRQHVVATLRDNGVDVNNLDQRGKVLLPPAGPEPHRFRLNTAEGKYFRWSLTTDGSLGNAWLGRPDVAPLEKQLSWTGLELVSPAMRDEPASYQELEQVVDLLKARCRILVNITCGLHVHAAFGLDPIPFAGLKRCAALLFAMDPVVAEIHPRHRRDNTFARPIRTQSNAAMGWTAHDAVEAFAESEHNQFGWLRYRDPLPNTPIGHAVREILACPSPGPVCWLLATTFTKGNYDFARFASSKNRNPTLEFRQHEGTVDAKRMSAWARFCTGILRYAVQELTDEKLAEAVVPFCETAEKDKSGKLYLYELLDSFGMADQARALGLQPDMRREPSPTGELSVGGVSLG
ncbi:hypothetical protein PG985_001666 [Apiospora marii]|uniref:uncharacterized protein n=1 Tax=Apiospora marii TaxID=335849 RepID=UPI00313166ED